MPRRFKRFRRQRRYRYRGRTTRRFRRKVLSTVSRASEKKYVTTVLSNISIQRSPDSVLWNVIPIAGGSGKAGRIGNKVYCRYVKVQGTISFEGATSATTCRMMVVIARTGGLTLAEFPNGPESPIDVDRYHVIYDSLFTRATDGTLGPSVYPVNKTFRIMRSVIYDTGTATLATRNQVFIYLTSDDTTLPSPTAFLNSTAWFLDI